MHQGFGKLLNEFTDSIAKGRIALDSKQNIIGDLDFEEEKKDNVKTVINKKEPRILAGQLSSMFDRYGRMLVDSGPLLLQYAKPDIIADNKIKRENGGVGLDINVPLMPNPLDLKPLQHLVENNRSELTIHALVERQAMHLVDNSTQTEGDESDCKIPSEGTMNTDHMGK